MMEFNQDLISGIKQLDEDHQRLIRIINQIHQACEGFIDQDKLIELVNELEFYSGEHFDIEENYAQEVSYERIDDLKREHYFFKNVYQEIKYTINQSKEQQDDYQYQYIHTLRLACILESWLEKHLYSLDQELMNLIRKKFNS